MRGVAGGLHTRPSLSRVCLMPPASAGWVWVNPGGPGGPVAGFGADTRPSSARCEEAMAVSREASGGALFALNIEIYTEGKIIAFSRLTFVWNRRL